MKTIWHRLLLLLLLGAVTPGGLWAQSLRKMQRNAINRTRLTLVNGDTIQRFTTTRRHPHPRPDRFYYWQGQDHILRTVGGYNGHLLDGSYQLTDRADHLLGAGAFQKGLKTGTWRKWRADGSLASTSRWRHGRQRGRTIAYDINSQPLPLPKPAPLPPTTVAAVATQPQVPHWWQTAYRKLKFKPRKTKATVVTPPAGPAPAVPPTPKKKKVSQPSPPLPASPQKAGS